MTVVDPIPPSMRQATTEVRDGADRAGTKPERYVDGVQDVADRLLGGAASQLQAQASEGPAVRRHSSTLGSRVGLKYLGRVRAWMVVPVVDFLMLMAPLAWRPPQLLTIMTMAVLGTLLLSGGGRYVAPLHLSVMDVR